MLLLFLCDYKNSKYIAIIVLLVQLLMHQLPRGNGLVTSSSTTEKPSKNGTIPKCGILEKGQSGTYLDATMIKFY